MSESTRNEIIPPKREKPDIVDSVMETAISAIPVLESPALHLFNLVVTPPLERRLNEWRNTVAERIQQLEGKLESFKVEDLGRNPMFITAVMQATQIALRNHQKEKLEALQNAVVNSAREIDLEDDLQLLFLNLVDSLTLLHLKLLRFLDEPAKYVDAHTINTFVSGSVIHILHKAFPELAERSDLYLPVIQDLFNRGLLVHDKTGLSAVMMGPSVLSSHTSSLGKKFLKYISSE